MRIHYNNAEKEKIIDNVLSIQVIDGNQPVVVLMANGKELTVSLRNIEMILDEAVFKKPKPKTNFDRITENIDTFIAWINKNFHNLSPEEMPCKAESNCDGDCDKCFKEWLQKECE